MILGQVLLICAAALVALGVAQPMLNLLRIQKRTTFIWIVAVSVCLMIEYKLAAIAIALPAVGFAAGLHWRGGLVRVLFGSLIGGAAAVGYLAIQRRLNFEPGLIAGILAAGVASAATRYRRVSLAAGFAALPAATFMLAWIESWTGALISVPRVELLNAAVASALSICLFTAAWESWRARRRFAELKCP